ncbi:dual specificity tyrosine-phosphorylation-regulated kinase 1B-like isoform X2 [Corythoichthys intestinalis]|uniref:dual specificity tyrosine-phosphorylation-regulated kinase 1B-like isoform X2 n=1 Tax=Corythoichthys intestinalis TaxID=161448 RepID=UPI0025A5D472|nr:dual specificity tyrosine-phosphorylation-regulated kinase 1B-like isoform X2 [Corythoichthys intestinalis]
MISPNFDVPCCRIAAGRVVAAIPRRAVAFLKSSTHDTARSSEVDTQELAEMEGSIVESKSGFYHVHKLLDRGTSSHVFKCKNLATAKDVALKVHKNYALFENEINMQEIVSVLDSDKKSIVEFIETFTYNGHPCLVFELLDTSLFSMVLDKKWKTFSPNDIRPVAQQLLTAFDALKSIGVIHTDLKSDNIMLVNHTAAPFRVKLIDFGLSIITEDAPLSYGVALQPMGNRAPEVALGLPFSEAIDMWSLGCVLSFLYLGNYLFLANSNYNMLRSMIEVVGGIPDHLLMASKNTPKYFKRSDRDNDGDHPKWRLMRQICLQTEREYQDKTGVRPESLPWTFKSLDDLVKLKPEAGEPVEMEDREAFVDLLKCLLHMDPERRITPEDALRHPFLTMSHLSEHKTTSLYVNDSLDKMKFCPASNSDKCDSGQTVKARNWRQKFCRLLGPRRSGEQAPPPPGRAPAVEPPPARDPDAEPRTWWRRLCRVFNGRTEPPPPKPEVPPEKTWWIKICLFFRMKRIVPEPCRVPLRRGGTAEKLRTQRDLRAESLPPPPPPTAGRPLSGVYRGGSSPLRPATREGDLSRALDKRSFRAEVRPATPEAGEVPSARAFDKRLRVGDRSARVAETTRRPDGSRVRRGGPSGRAEDDSTPRAKRDPVDTGEPARLYKPRAGRGPSSPADGRRGAKTADWSARAKCRAAGASPTRKSRVGTERSRVQKDKADSKRAPAAATRQGASRTRSDLPYDLNYLNYLSSGVKPRKTKKMA